MEYDGEGFYYPVVDSEKCINCNSCVKACPYREPKVNRSESMDVYGCQHQSENVRMNSTSGGMFTVLAQYVLDKNGVVFGAGFDSNMHLIHKAVTDSKDLEELRKSKYTQSQLGDSFALAKSYLKDDRYVLFVGLPCQIEGLVSFLKGQDTAKLVTVDLKCYGVPSPELYDKWIAFLGEKYGSKIKHIYFRDKKYGYSGVNVKAVLENGKVLEDNLDLKSYGKTMFSKVGLRPSCYNCKFRKIKRASDFTLGDIWSIGKYNSEMDDNIGTTLLEVHSDKGRKVFEEIKGTIISTPIADYRGESLDTYLEKMDKSYKCNSEKRNNFFKEMHTMDYGNLMAKYFPPSKKDKINNIAKPLIHKFPGSKLIFRFLKSKRSKRANKK
jgi:coenzyme F420-reducing hydrogenase beta subunit